VSGYDEGGRGKVYVDQQLFRYKIWLVKEVIYIIYTPNAKEIRQFFSSVIIYIDNNNM